MLRERHKISVVLCGSLWFSVKLLHGVTRSYTENHRGGTENHRGRLLYNDLRTETVVKSDDVNAGLEFVFRLASGEDGLETNLDAI